MYSFYIFSFYILFDFYFPIYLLCKILDDCFSHVMNENLVNSYFRLCDYFSQMNTFLARSMNIHETFI
jgi:hypothetical protein